MIKLNPGREQDARLLKGRQIHNRPEDLAWAEEKLAWLWQASRAAGPIPPVVVDEGVGS
jgi:hypothetical protein